MEAKSKITSMLSFGIGVIVLTLLDQITKQAAQHTLKGNDAIVLIQNVFELHYLENRGSAFGLLQGQRSLFVIMAALMLFFIPYIYHKIPLTKRFWYLRVIAALFLSGAVGNAIDRILHGYVIDFFYFSLINFPIFNVADIYVTVSTFLLVLLFLFYYKDEDIAQIHIFIRFKKSK